MKPLVKITLAGFFSLAVLAFLGLAIGVRRYEGMAGLNRRVRVAMADMRPRPAAAPTIHPQATVDPAAIARLLPPPLPPTSFPLPTLYPTRTPLEVKIEAAASPTPTATPIYDPLATFVHLSGYTHQWQTWNNCAPATLSTYLSFWGVVRSQEELASRLKPNPDDKNVNPAEVAALASSLGLATRLIEGGTTDQLKLLLSNGLPVMIETWLEPGRNDGMGHYRLLIGYDEEKETWLASDSYVSEGVESPYAGIKIAYRDLEQKWPVFNRQMVVIYPAGRSAVVEAILGSPVIGGGPNLIALAGLQGELQERPQDPFLWHNVGRVLLDAGETGQAAAAFDQARSLGLPWRMFWYQFDIFEAYAAAGRFDDILDLAQATIDSGGGGEEVYYWKGMALAELGDMAGAAAAWRHALWWHPAYEPALVALRSLPQ